MAGFFEIRFCWWFSDADEIKMSSEPTLPKDIAQKTQMPTENSYSRKNNSLKISVSFFKRKKLAEYNVGRGKNSGQENTRALLPL